MKILFLAFRNLLRQKRRTLITLLALIIGLTGLTVFQGFITQNMKGFRDSTIRSGVGHLQVSSKESYFDDGEFNPYDSAFPNSNDIEHTLKTTEGVTDFFPSTGFTSIAGKDDKSLTLLVKAYPGSRMYFSPPGNNQSAFPPGAFTLGSLISGRGLTSESRDEIIIGETAARILKAQCGQVITLMAVLPQGALNGRDFTVAGIYRSAGRDKIFAYTDYESAKEFTFLAGPPVFHLFTGSPEEAKKVKSKLPNTLTVKTWDQLAQFYVQVNTMFVGFLGVIRLILLLITLFILANTMNRIVFERMREWGTLKALGTKGPQLLALIVCEGALLGLAGGLAGLGLGYITSAGINFAGGIPFTYQGDTFKILVSPNWDELALGLIPVVLTAALSALIPGIRAMRTSAAQALRQI